MKRRTFVAQQGMNKWKKPLLSGVQRALDSRFVVPLNSMIHRQALYIRYILSLLLSYFAGREQIHRDIHEHTLMYMNTHEHITISYPDSFHVYSCNVYS